MSRGKHRYIPSGSFLPQPKFRPEIQGLRSLAVLLVVLYHVWFGRVSGGVDVFLFISAFLLSTSSLRKIQEGKPLRVVSYWLHVFQRLLPAAVTVIAGTLVAAYFIVAPSRWASLLDDAQAALFYRLNWRLAENAVDYYAQNASVKTPFQHFWSLSMQGQIFILWPLLFALIAFLVSYLRLKVIPTALLIFGSVFVASLTFSVIETYSNQAYAYFDTRTRLWEFAAGTLLAMLLLIWRVPDRLKVPMGWLGIIGLVTCGWLLPVQQAFPGFLALWPLLSGAMVIAAGQTGSPYGADRLLGTKPLQKLGAISYCLYLVHWPLLILYTTYAGKEQAGFLDGSLVILASIGLAWLLHQGVEKPLRAWEKKPSRSLLSYLGFRAGRSKGFRHSAQVQAARRPLLVIAACLLLVAGPVSLAQGWVQNQENYASEFTATNAGTPDYPGALVFRGTEQRVRNLTPIPRFNAFDQYDGATNSCVGFFVTANPELNDYCTYEQYGPEDAPLTMIIGASHAGQAVAPWREIARETGSNFKDLHLGACRFPQEPEPGEDCTFLNKNILREVLDTTPDTVLLLVTVTDPETNQETLLPGIEDAIEQMTVAGIRVVALRDNPRFTYNNYECAQGNLQHPERCSATLDEKYSPLGNPAQRLVDSNPLVYGVDLSQVYCPDGVCQPVIGNIYVYMDDNHISKAFGKTTATFVLEQLEAQGWTLTSG